MRVDIPATTLQRVLAVATQFAGGSLPDVWLEFSTDEGLHVFAADNHRAYHANIPLQVPAPAAEVVGLPNEESVPLLLAYLRSVGAGNVTLTTDNPEFTGWIAGITRLMLPRTQGKTPPAWRAKLRGTDEPHSTITLNAKYLASVITNLRGDKVVLHWPRQGEAVYVIANEPETEFGWSSEAWVMPVLTYRVTDVNVKESSDADPAGGTGSDAVGAGAADGQAPEAEPEFPA